MSTTHSGAKDETDELRLDGKSFDGKIRAEGVFGLVSVKGVLSFENGFLIWSSKGTDERGSYNIEKAGDVIEFTAQSPLLNGEFVEWSGEFDGENVKNVKAIWTRKKGDFVHDLLLPGEVTLVFEQNK